jgi:hypothetical protein
MSRESVGCALASYPEHGVSNKPFSKVLAVNVSEI